MSFTTEEMYLEAKQQYMVARVRSDAAFSQVAYQCKRICEEKILALAVARVFPVVVDIRWSDEDGGNLKKETILITEVKAVKYSWFGRHFCEIVFHHKTKKGTWSKMVGELNEDDIDCLEAGPNKEDL